MTALERRCRWLLRAYPAWYRAQRGEEMLTTLLEASPPSARWPSARDARALIMGGLRVRAWGTQRPGTAASLRLALLLGVSMALVWYFAGSLGGNILFQLWIPRAAVLNPDLSYYEIATDVLALAAVAAAWFAPRPVVVTALACVAMWAFYVATWENPGGWVVGIRPAGLLDLMAILMCGRQRLPRSWLWLAGAIFAVNMLDVIMYLVPLRPVHDLIYAPLDFAPWLILGAVALWAAVDARPAIAMAIWITSSYFPFELDLGSPYKVWTWQWYLPAAGSAVLAAAAIWRLRRQAVL